MRMMKAARIPRRSYPCRAGQHRNSASCRAFGDPTNPFAQSVNTFESALARQYPGRAVSSVRVLFAREQSAPVGHAWHTKVRFVALLLLIRLGSA